MTKASNDNWWRGGVIYQIYPRSFADSNGDGIGDLDGITAKLDYVAALGADGIWLSPFFKSPMKDFGYDITDYCDVDPMFGTLADFDALIAEIAVDLAGNPGERIGEAHELLAVADEIELPILRLLVSAGVDECLVLAVGDLVLVDPVVLESQFGFALKAGNEQRLGIVRGRHANHGTSGPLDAQWSRRVATSFPSASVWPCLPYCSSTGRT